MNFYIYLAISFSLAFGEVHAQDRQEEVVVTGTRTEHTVWDSPIPTQTVVIDDKALQHYRNLAELLARSPAVDLVNGIRGQSIRLDGLDAKYTLVLIDGQRIGGRIGEAYDLQGIELDGVQRVEIIRGAGSALYGSDAIGGVVNIITRNDVRHRARIQGDTNGQRSALIATGVRGENSSIAVDMFGNDDKPIQLNGSEATSFSGSKKIGAQIVPRVTGSNWDLKARLQASRETLDATELSPAGAILTRENKLGHSSVGLEPSIYFEDESQIRLTLKHDQSQDDYTQKLRRTAAVQTHEETTEKLIETGLVYIKPVANHTLNIGFQNLDEVLISDRLEQNSVDRNRSAIYIQDEISLIDGQLTLIPAVRQDYDTQYRDHTNKKLALRYSPNTANAFMLSYGEGYRAPSFKELHLLFENNSVGYVVEGNSELTPETSRNLHAQYNYRSQGQWSIGIGAFHDAIQDLIEDRLLGQDAAGIQRYTYENIARAETAGVNLDYFRTFNPEWNLGISYNYLHARDLSRQVALEGRSKHAVSTQIRFVRNSFSLAHQLKWQSAREPSAKADLSNAKSIVTGDLSLSYRQDKAWLYSLAIENIGASSGDVYWRIPRRSLSFSLTWIPFT